MFAMQWMRAMDHLRSLRDREEGQGLVEYSLILALISVVAIGLLTTIGEDIKAVLGEIVGGLV